MLSSKLLPEMESTEASQKEAVLARVAGLSPQGQAEKLQVGSAYLLRCWQRL